jgi:hypothetical protein
MGKKVKYINPPSSTVPFKSDKNNGAERVREGKVDYTKFEKGTSKFESKKAGDGYDHQGPAVIPSKGDERVRPGKVDYTKYEKGTSKFQSNKAGDGYDHQGPAKSTPSKGDERCRPGKVDYTKFEKAPKKVSPFKKFDSQ